METAYDFGIIEGSIDGSSWTVLPVNPNYTEMSLPWATDCLGLEPFPAFSGYHNNWKEYTSNLSKYAGNNFFIRYNVETDETVSLGGWFIDDISIDVADICINTSPNCSTPPKFNGITSAAGIPQATCQINLSWNPGSLTCPSYPNLTYHIYRSTDPNFTPSPSNRIASCITANSYSDTDVNYGTTYYYIVRAEDNSSNGNGPCNSGNTDINLVRIGGTPGGAIFYALNDNFESATSKWQLSGLWSLSDSHSNSGTYSAYSGSNNNQCDTITMANFIYAPNHSSISLSFWLYYNIENEWDGAVVQLSQDGIKWNTIDMDPYPSTTNSSTTACIGQNQPCYSRSQTWIQQITGTDDYTFGRIKLRFLYATNDSNALEGLYIDDVVVQYTYCSSVSTPGTVSDNDNYPGLPLTVAKNGNSYLELSWSAPPTSCITQNYGIYRGTLPWNTYNH